MRGENQLIGYLNDYHLQTGYMLSFNFNKKKQSDLSKYYLPKTATYCWGPDDVPAGHKYDRRTYGLVYRAVLHWILRIIS